MKSFFTKTTNVILSIIIVAVALLVAIFSITKNNKSTNSSLTANNLFAVNYAELTDPHPYYLDEDGNYQLDEEENIIDPCENINFEAYFPQKQGTGVVRHSLGTCKSLDENDIFLLRLEVNQDGYLKDGKIYFNGKNIAFTKSNQGVGFQSGEVFKEKVTRTLALQNQIEAGNAGVCEISISPNVLTSEDYHREDNIITLTGTYVDGENVEHSIRKDIPLTVDWYGKAKAYLQNRNNSVAYSRYLNQRGKIIIEFTVSETEEQLVPEAVCAVLDFNDESAMLAGEYPTSVVCQDGVYDAETRKLTIRRETTNRSNTFSVEVNYSDDVYDRVSNTNQEFNGYSLRIPVSAYYECSNNTSIGLESPFVTDTVSGTSIVNFHVDYKHDGDNGLLTYINFTNTLNEVFPGEQEKHKMLVKNNIVSKFNIENEDERYYDYNVLWSVEGNLKQNIACHHTFEDKNGDEVDGEVMDFVSIKSIRFGNNGFIDNDGYVDVFDCSQDEKRLIKRFTSSEVLQYTKEEYQIEGNVKKLCIQTNDRTFSGDYTSFSVNIRKRMDLRGLQISDIWGMGLIKTYYSVKKSDQENEVNGSDECMLITQQSHANLRGEKDINIGQSNEIERTYLVETRSGGIYSQWQNPVFLIRLPDFVDYAKVLNSDDFDIEPEVVRYNNNVCVIIRKKSDTPTSYSIPVRLLMGVNPTTVSGLDMMALYAYNEYNDSYFSPYIDEYDINGNGSKRDSVCMTMGLLNVSVAEGFKTWEALSEYDNFDSRNYAPNLAEIEKGSTRSAKVGVNIVNTYKSSGLIEKIENIAILGKIPYQNNTYINGANLGSTFSTTMKDNGITVPSELENYAKVYYSTKENPTKDLSDSTNEWKLKEEVSSFESVKSYLIILENMELQNGSGYEFTYEINIPEDGLKSNDKTYSCHMVYGDIIVSGEKDPITLQPSKLGIRIVRNYDLDITKLKENTDLPILGAGFSLKEVENPDDDEFKSYRNETRFSNSEGKIVFEKLIANQEYTIKETYAPNNYEMNDKEIRFKLTENTNGDLNFEVLSNEGFDRECTVDTTSSIPKVSSAVFDAPKFKLVIHKVEKETGNPIKDAIFTVDGKRYISKTDGSIEASRFSVGQSYVVQEIENEGYYVDDSEVEFSIVKDGNNYVVSSENEIFQNALVTNDETQDLITVDVTIENEKIPTYNLKIVKVDSEDDNQKLAGAVFITKRYDGDRISIEETNDDGEIYLPGLYQYVEGKYITGQFEIYEEEAPNGYVKNDERIKFVVTKQDDELVMTIDNFESIATVKDVIVDGDTITLKIQDRAVFELVKKDKDTGEPLKNAEFKIIDLSTNDYAKDVDGNYIGTKNSNGDYVVVTDENGKVTLPLSDGNYRAVEVGYPEGYMETPNTETFTIQMAEKEYMQLGARYDRPTVLEYEVPEVPYEEFSSTHELEEETYNISKIEDLVQFANDVKSNPDSFANKKVKLLNDLDFNNDSDYNDPNGTSFGDINGDENTEGIKAELTTGAGFPGIGTHDGTDAVPFKGVFDGNGKKISNLYINKNGGHAGFFVATENAEIYNLELKGTVTATVYASGLIANASGVTYIENVDLDVVINASSAYSAGMITYTDGSCYFKECNVNGEISGNVFVAGFVGAEKTSLGTDEAKPIISIENCADNAKITGSGTYTAGFVANQGVANCYMKGLEVSGTIEGQQYTAGIIAFAGSGGRYRLENITISADITASGSNIAGVISYITGGAYCVVNNAKVQNCTVGGTSMQEVGGIIGQVGSGAYAYITNCDCTNVEIIGSDYVGGIVGGKDLWKLYIDNCNVVGTINTGSGSSRGNYVGGILRRFIFYICYKNT